MHMSNETARAIDTEIRDIVEAGYDRAKYVLTENETQLHLLANALLEYETLSGEEIKALLDTGEFTREDGVNVRPASVPPVVTSILKTRRRNRPFSSAAPLAAFHRLPFKLNHRNFILPSNLRLLATKFFHPP